MNILIIEEASLEILPRESRSSRDAKRVAERFGVSPQLQILDRNFHPNIVRRLGDRDKRGRPDVVHFALLEVTSAPLFEKGLLKLIVRTRDGIVIHIKTGTRLPRTLQRFCGVASKLLSGKSGENEKKLFDVEEEKMSFPHLVEKLQSKRVISFSSRGTLTSLHKLVTLESKSVGNIAWVVGGFPHGHFNNDVIKHSDVVVSVSSESLPSHVVTARLCYEIEEAFKV
jgi:rRNA small subunit pseudouridine methyltransferase Nep1